MQTLTIKHKFPTLNDYIKTERSHKLAAAKLKKQLTELVAWECRAQKIKPAGKIKLQYTWYEKNRKRDLDNIAFNQKFIQDGLVKAGVIKNDGWKYIGGFTHEFEVSKEYGVKIEIVEV